MGRAVGRIGCVLAILVAVRVERAGAQASQRGQPKTAFSVTDFAKLHWLEGSWRATATGESTMFERYHFSNDSTIDISYYADSASGRETGTARLYLSIGRIYYTLGPGRWGATRVDSSGIYFVPQVNANNTFAWAYESPSAWTSTMRTGMGGRERVTVYRIQRAAR